VVRVDLRHGGDEVRDALEASVPADAHEDAVVRLDGVQGAEGPHEAVPHPVRLEVVRRRRL
jgi:hypothetical protein